MKITVRNMDLALYARFKQLAKQQGKKLGSAASEAMCLWLEERETQKAREQH